MQLHKTFSDIIKKLMEKMRDVEILMVESHLNDYPPPPVGCTAFRSFKNRYFFLTSDLKNDSIETLVQRGKYRKEPISKI